MSNFTITNKQGSILSLSPLLDEAGAALVLSPKGHKGDSKTISAETAEHEIVERVRKVNWVSLAPIGGAASAPVKAVTPPPPSVPEPAAAPELTSELTSEPVAAPESMSEPTPEPTLEPVAAPEAASEPEPTPEPPPVKRRR